MTIFLRGKGATYIADSLSGDPPSGSLAKWFGGCLMPTPFLVYGIVNCVKQKATLFGSLKLRGVAAIAMGAALVSIGLFLHFHYFWGNSDRLCGMSQFFKTIAVGIFVIGFGFVCWSVFMG